MQITLYIDDVGALNQIDLSESIFIRDSNHHFPFHQITRWMEMHIKHHPWHRSLMRWPDWGLKTIQGVRQLEDIK